MDDDGKVLISTDDPVSDPELLASASIYSPILRYGRAVSAAANGNRFVFNFGQLDRAIKTLEKHRKKFEKPLNIFFKKNGWDVDQKNKKLAGFRIVRKLGAVIDFPEIMVSKDGCRNIVRASVTVCVDKRGLIDEHIDEADCELNTGLCWVPKTSNLKLFSKIWIRTACIEFEGTKICDKTTDKFLDFAEEFEGFSESIIESMIGAYTVVLADMADKPAKTIQVVTEETISNLTVSSEESSLRVMHDEISNNEFIVSDCTSLRASAYKNLFDGYFAYLNTGLTMDAPNVGCTSLHAFKTRFTKGVYAVQYCNKVTKIYGVAQSPFWTSGKFSSLDGMAEWKHSPANALGAIAMTAIASRL